MDKVIAGLTILATLGAALLGRDDRRVIQRIGVYATTLAAIGAIGLVVWGLIGVVASKPPTYGYLELDCHAGLAGSTVSPDSEFFLDVRSGRFYSTPGHRYGTRLKHQSYADCALSNTGDRAATAITIPFKYEVHPAIGSSLLGGHDFTGVGYIVIGAAGRGSVVHFRIIDDSPKSAIAIAPSTEVMCVVPPELWNISCPVPFSFQAMSPISLIPLSSPKKFGRQHGRSVTDPAGRCSDHAQHCERACESSLHA